MGYSEKLQYLYQKDSLSFFYKKVTECQKNKVTYVVHGPFLWNDGRVGNGCNSKCL